MIFHTACDPLYYKKFFSIYQTSIEKNFKNPKFSLNYISDTTIDANNIFNLTYDKITISQIEKRFNTEGRNSLGYYAIARFLSLPDLNDHVIVSDVDIATINKIDEELILDLLKKYKVINITRKKPNGLEGGMAIMVIHKDICKDVASYANEVIKTMPLKWNTDVNVKKFLLNNYKNTSLLKMHDISKNNNIDNIDAWFVFSKIGQLKESKLRSVL